MLGFVSASFAIRNSDFWMHLGTGRLIAQGNYEFGRAPFTYAGNDRHYTNHSWLFDLGLYSVYSAGKENGEAAVVIVKAAAIAVLALLLLLMSRSWQTLWFSVVTVGLALLASAPELLLQPIVGSYVFFGATLFLLVRLGRREGSYQLPIAIAVLFWIWANFDAWFFIGPLTVALFLLGQCLQMRLRRFVRNHQLQIDNAHPDPFAGGRLYCLHTDAPSHPSLGIAARTGIERTRKKLWKRR